MNRLEEYLQIIAEPTLEDFRCNPNSIRHAYLACLVAYHAVDRAAYPKKPGNLRKKWRDQSVEFAIIDMIAHHLKHVVSDDEKYIPDVEGISLSDLIFGHGAYTIADGLRFNQGGVPLHLLQYVIRDCIKFLHEQAAGLK